MHLVCQFCQSEFTTYDKRRKYCSVVCYGKASVKPPPTYTCRNCGVTFADPSYSPYRHFCSVACHNAWMPKQRPRLRCKHCGKTFTSSRGHSARPLFCGRACYIADRRAAVKHYTCVHCGKDYINLSGNTKSRFCSRACQMAHRGPSSIEFSVADMLAALGAEFSPQYQLDAFVFDFIVPAARLLIECDGTYWHASAEAKNRDRIKTNLARRSGFRVLRLPQYVIEKEPLACRAKIAIYLRQP